MGEGPNVACSMLSSQVLVMVSMVQSTCMSLHGGSTYMVVLSVWWFKLHTQKLQFLNKISLNKEMKTTNLTKRKKTPLRGA